MSQFKPIDFNEVVQVGKVLPPNEKPYSPDRCVRCDKSFAEGLRPEDRNRYDASSLGFPEETYLCNECKPDFYDEDINQDEEQQPQERPKIEIGETGESFYCIKCEKTIPLTYRIESNGHKKLNRYNIVPRDPSSGNQCEKCYMRDWTSNKRGYTPRSYNKNLQQQGGKRIKVILMDGTYQEFDNVRDIAIIEEKKLGI